MRYSDLLENKKPLTYGPDPFAKEGIYEVVIYQKNTAAGLVELEAVVYVSGLNKVKGRSLIFRGTPTEAAQHTDYIEQAALQSLKHFAS